MPQLTETELIALTGAKRPSAQKRVLDRHKIRYIERIDGAIVTTWEAVNAVLTPAQAHQEEQPNFDWLKHGTASQKKRPALAAVRAP